MLSSACTITQYLWLSARAFLSLSLVTCCSVKARQPASQPARRWLGLFTSSSRAAGDSSLPLYCCCYTGEKKRRRHLNWGKLIFCSPFFVRVWLPPRTAFVESVSGVKSRQSSLWNLFNKKSWPKKSFSKKKLFVPLFFSPLCVRVLYVSKKWTVQKGASDRQPSRR